MYTELTVSGKVKFSKFCKFCPKNMLPMRQSPADQCKCIIDEKLKALPIWYGKDTVQGSTNSSQSMVWSGEGGRSDPLYLLEFF